MGGSCSGGQGAASSGAPAVPPRRSIVPLQRPETRILEPCVGPSCETRARTSHHRFNRPLLCLLSYLARVVRTSDGCDPIDDCCSSQAELPRRLVARAGFEPATYSSGLTGLRWLVRAVRLVGVGDECYPSRRCSGPLSYTGCPVPGFEPGSPAEKAKTGWLWPTPLTFVWRTMR